MTVYHTTYRGSIQAGTANEIFSHSHGIESAAPEATVAAAMKTAWTTAWGTTTNLGTFFPPGVQYLEVTVARVIDPMVPDLGAAHHELFVPPLQGRGTGGMLPPQNAVAVSLTAGIRPNGKPFKGRFYLPVPAFNATVTDGSISNAGAATIADLLKTYCETLNAAGHVVSIWSRTVEDLVNKVTQIRIGNRVDTIRSRRNAVPEVYETRAII